MFKIAVTKPESYLSIKRYPILRAFFAPRLTSIAHLDPKLFTKYISAVRGPSGVYMSTKENRFSDVDSITLEYMKDVSENLVHDVGVSSGVTTLDLFNLIQGQRIPFKLFFSEKYSELFASGHHFCKVCSCNKFIEGYWMGLLASESVSWLFPVTRILFVLMKLVDTTKSTTRISILDPRIRDLMTLGQVTEIEYDFFNSDVRNIYTFVRCMNLLNLDYFDRRQLRLAVKTLLSSLKENGVLLIGRTDIASGRNSVTFFRKEKNKIIIIREINGGTEISACIDDMIEPLIAPAGN